MILEDVHIRHSYNQVFLAVIYCDILSSTGIWVFISRQDLDSGGIQTSRPESR